VLLVLSFVPYLMAIPAFPTMLLSGNLAEVRSALVINGTMVGGALGIVSILMAYDPERLRQNQRRKRLAMIFAGSGVCALLLYFANGGANDSSSHLLARWVVLAPLAVGIHCLYRVFSPRNTARS